MKKLLFLIILVSSLCCNAWCGVDFDAVDDVISKTAGVDLGTDGSFSCSAWIYADSSGEDQGRIFRCTTAELGAGRAFFGIQDLGGAGGVSDCTLLVYDQDGFEFARSDGDDVSEGAWHNIIGTATNGVTIKLYVDGTEVSSYSTQNTPNGNIENTDTDEIFVGAESAGSETFDGQITELAIWNALLTAKEIELLSNSRGKGMPLQIQPSTLRMYLPLDDISGGTSGDGVTFIDRSGSGNDGTGDDGANNTGLAAASETVLSYP